MEDLLALAELDAVLELLGREDNVDGCNLLVISEHAALLDETARLGLRGRELAGEHQVQNADPAIRELAFRQLRCRHIGIVRAAEEQSPRRITGLIGLFLAVDELRQLIGENFLGLVELAAFPALHGVDLLEREEGQHAQALHDVGIVNKKHISVATKSGIKYLDLTVKDGKVSLVKVNMGSPILTAKQIPVVSEKEEVINEPLVVDGETYYITAVSMGNPHAIVYMADIDHLDIEKIGPSFENHVAFPDRVNTEFVEVIDEHTLKMRVWERGSGETLACGTGACAVAVASILNGHVDGDKSVTVKLLGGDLQIFWNRQENLVYMTGPATTVFDGEIDVSFLK